MILSAPHTFHALPLPTGGSPFRSASKHVRMTYNPFTRKHWTQGGDWGTGSGDHRCWEWEIRTNTWTLASTYCHPPGEYTPAENDERPVYYDLVRRKVVTMQGISTLGGASNGTICTHDGSAGRAGTPQGSINKPNATMSFPDAAPRKWAIEMEGSPPHGRWSQYDPVRDEVTTTTGGPSGGPGGSESFSCISAGAFVRTRNFSFNFIGEDSQHTYATFHLDNWAQDNIGRKAYCLGGRALKTPDGPVPGSGIPYFVGVDLDTGTVTPLPPPPIPDSFGIGKIRNNMIQVTWDTRRRAVVYFHTLTVCGVVRGVYVYRPQTNRWETYPVVAAGGVGTVFGNCAFYDPDEEVHCLSGGGVFCADEGDPGRLDNAQDKVYLWQLGA